MDTLGKFADPSLLILISLAPGPKHGYAMIQDIEQFSGKRLGPGTLYGAIARLEADAFIEPMASEDRRQPYRLTALGSKSLREQITSLERFMRMASARVLNP